MYLSSILAAAGLAATTVNALLLPPDLTLSEDDIITTLPVPTKFGLDIPQIAEARNMKLPCRGSSECDMKGLRAEDDATAAKSPTHLELDFSVERTHSDDRLMLNGYELYPNPDPFSAILTATVLPDVPTSPSKQPPRFKGIRPMFKPTTLGYGLQTRPVETSDDEDDLELILVELQIIEIGKDFTDDVPSVEVKLIKTGFGKLMIADIEVIETPPRTPKGKGEECTTMICRSRAAVMEKLAQLSRPSRCRFPGHRAGWSGAGLFHGMHSGKHHDKHRHQWAHLFRNVASHILLPVAFGIMAGITASIIGMMFGTFIVFLWRTFIRRPSSRRHRRCGHRSKAAPSETAFSDEKVGLMEQQHDVEVPPAFVESGNVAIDDQKSENEA